MSLPWLLRFLTVQAVMHPRRMASGICRSAGAEIAAALKRRSTAR